MYRRIFVLYHRLLQEAYTPENRQFRPLFYTGLPAGRVRFDAVLQVAFPQLNTVGFAKTRPLESRDHFQGVRFSVVKMNARSAFSLAKGLLCLFDMTVPIWMRWLTKQNG